MINYFYLLSILLISTSFSQQISISEIKRQEINQFAKNRKNKIQTKFDKTEVMDGWASGLKEIKGSSNIIYAKRVFKQTNGTMYIDIIQEEKYSKYDQKNKVVQFDGEKLKWSYSAYYCLSTPDLKEFFPCETKFNFIGTVVSTSPLILDVIIIEKTWGTDATSESKSQWIFNI